jgi:hypothetical protein
MKSLQISLLRKVVSFIEKPRCFIAFLILFASLLGGEPQIASAATIGWEVKNGLMDGKTLQFNYDIIGKDAQT